MRPALTPVAVTVAITLAAWAFAAIPTLSGDVSVDVLLWLRERLAPVRTPDEPVAVVAIDEETYRRAPFDALPQALWAPQVGKVLSAMLDGGVRVIGFDVVYPTSVDRLFPGFERDLLLALRRGGAEGRIVLGQLQQHEQPVNPFPGYVLAVGGNANLRPLNLPADADGVIRRVPLSFEGRRGPVPSMASELAWRGRGVETGTGSLLLNFPGDLGTIPRFSFADLHACDDPAFFARNFAGRIVLFSVVLDVEDRRLAANRLITRPEQPAAQRCRFAPMTGLHRAGARRPTIPGVYVHAVAVGNLVRGDALATLPAAAAAALELGAGALVATLGLCCGLVLAAAGAGGVLVAATLAAGAAVAGGVVVPLVPIATALAASLGLTALYRYGVVDRARRRIRHAFAYYLPTAVVDRLVRQGRLPELGGEMRDVTVLFIDIAGFTTMAEGHDPSVLVDEVNRYFDAVSRVIVDEHNGYVDRFLGDAVLALFGAPVEDPGHAGSAVAAALRIQSLLAGGGFRIAGRAVRARIGVNTGRALIGNIGAARHFSYTAMGDDVNLAARIEAANKQHGTAILVSAACARACAGSFVFREVATVQVRGRVEPVTLFEPLGAAGSTGSVVRARAGETVP